MYLVEAESEIEKTVANDLWLHDVMYEDEHL